MPRIKLTILMDIDETQTTPEATLEALTDTIVDNPVDGDNLVDSKVEYCNDTNL